jgi:hypothetical protein
MRAPSSLFLSRKREEVAPIDRNKCLWVTQMNVAIKQLISSDSNNNIIFWRYRGFWADLSFLSNDGIHLNHGGILKYFKSVRSAVLHARHSIGNNINIP